MIVCSVLTYSGYGNHGESAFICFERIALYRSAWASTAFAFFLPTGLVRFSKPLERHGPQVLEKERLGLWNLIGWLVGFASGNSHLYTMNTSRTIVDHLPSTTAKKKKIFLSRHYTFSGLLSRPSRPRAFRSKLCTKSKTVKLKS